MSEARAEPVEFETTIWIVYERATGDIVVTHRLSAPPESSSAHRRTLEASLLESAAGDSGRNSNDLALLMLEEGEPTHGAFFRVDISRGTLITVDNPRTLQHGTTS
jgi:hypothetical protein